MSISLKQFECVKREDFPLVPAEQFPLFKILLRLAVAKAYPSIQLIEELEAESLKLPQMDCQVLHHFSPGVYIREAIMPQGIFLIGHQHRHEHFNLASRGSARVWMNGAFHEVCAPFLLKSEAMVKKMFVVHEELSWSTIHPTTETDLAKIEADIFIKSKAFLEFEAKGKQ